MIMNDEYKNFTQVVLQINDLMTLHHNKSDIMTANSEHMDYVRQVRRPNSDNFL